MAMQKYIQTQELLAVLIEEVGEVGRALQGESNLEEELIHVASVCIRWLEIKDPVD
jgi:NTP pyrophosphatase (non-canonical NTP hydrolase)